MSGSSGYAVALTTTAREEEAEELAAKIVDSGLGACVQVLPIRSFYKWKGETCREREWLLLVKTRAALFAALEEFIRANHGYETPEIVQLPVERGFSRYLAWIDENTRR